MGSLQNMMVGPQTTGWAQGIASPPNFQLLN